MPELCLQHITAEDFEQALREVIHRWRDPEAREPMLRDACKQVPLIEKLLIRQMNLEEDLSMPTGVKVITQGELIAVLALWWIARHEAARQRAELN